MNRSMASPPLVRRPCKLRAGFPTLCPAICSGLPVPGRPRRILATWSPNHGETILRARIAVTCHSLLGPQRAIVDALISGCVPVEPWAMLKAVTLWVCAAFFLRATCHAEELTENTAFVPTPAMPAPGFEALRIKGLCHRTARPAGHHRPRFRWHWIRPCSARDRIHRLQQQQLFQQHAARGADHIRPAGL